MIDLGRHHVLPGFIDAHTHVLLQGDATEDDYDEQLLKESLPYRALRATRAMRIALDHGFTTLRDIGNEGAGFADVDLKRAVERASSAGPRLFVATKALAPTGAYGLSGYAGRSTCPKGVQMCDGPDACRRAVRDQIAHGADWIKVYADRGVLQAAGRADPQPAELHARGDERDRRPGAPHAAAGRGALDDPDRPRTSRWRPASTRSSTATCSTTRPSRRWLKQGLLVPDAHASSEFVAGPRSETNPIWTDLPTASGSRSGAR